MPDGSHKGTWRLVYTQLRKAGSGAFIRWEEIEGMTGCVRFASRSALVRAKKELEQTDGLTVVAQDAKGITLGPVISYH